MVISALLNGENETLFQCSITCNGNDLVVALLTARRVRILFDSIALFNKLHSAAAVRTTAVLLKLLTAPLAGMVPTSAGSIGAIITMLILGDDDPRTTFAIVIFDLLSTGIGGRDLSPNFHPGAIIFAIGPRAVTTM